MASEYQKRLIKEQQARAKAGVTMSNDPRTAKTRKSSSSNNKVIDSANTVQEQPKSAEPSKPSNRPVPVEPKTELTGRTMLSRTFTEEIKKGGSVESAIAKTQESQPSIRTPSPTVSVAGLPPELEKKKGTAKYKPDIKLQRTSTDKPFLSLEGQKQRFVRAGQSLELAGRQIGNVFVPGQPFTDKPTNLTGQEKFTQAITSPWVTLGGPALIASGTLPAVSSAKAAVGGTQVGKFAVSGTKAAVGGIGLTAAGKGIGEASLTKDQFELFQDPRVLKAYYQTREEAPDIQRSVSGKEFISGIERSTKAFTQPTFKGATTEFFKGAGTSLKGGVQFLGAAVGEEVTAFSRAAEEGESLSLFERKLSEQGFSERQIEKAKKGFTKKALAEDVGQLSGVIFAGREAEAYGRAATKGVSGANFGAKFMKTGGVIGQAGVFEGAVIESTAQIQKGKQTDFKRISGASALGGVSASVLGGTVGGLSGTKRGSAFEKTLYALDPSEPLGDVTQDIFEKGIKGGVKSKVLTPVSLPTQSFTQTKQEKVASLNFGKGGQPTISYTDVTQASKRKAPTKVVTFPEQVPSQPFTDIKKKSTIPVQPQPQTSVSPFTETPVQPFTETPVQPFTETPVQPQPEVPVNPFTQTQSQTQVNINPFSFTPQTLPVFPFLPGGGGGRGARSRLRKVSQPKDYVSSLGSAVLGIKGSKTEAGVISGLGIRPLQTGPSPKRRASKKRKRR